MKLIDTNLLRAANGRNTHATIRCQLACVTRLAALMSEADGPVLLDSLGHILKEYLRNASDTGQPGVGDQFLQWIIINQGNPLRCPLISITPHHERRYQEFPEDPLLADFDPSDRMFVAVALAHAAAGNPMPVIHNATDTDWARTDHHAAFLTHGLRIDFVCPDHVIAPK